MRGFIGISTAAIFALTLLAAGSEDIMAETFSVVSPDKSMEFIIDASDNLYYSVNYSGQSIIETSPISMTVNRNRVLGRKPRVQNSETRSVDETITPILAEKRATIPDFYNELRLEFRGNYGLVVRAYNDGVAYRFTTDMGGEIRVKSEQATFHFSSDDSVYFPVAQNMLTHFEESYNHTMLGSISQDSLGYMPFLVHRGDGIKILVTESDLDDYPGMFIVGSDDSAPHLQGKFAGVPLKERQESDRTISVVEHADYIAETEGSRSYPWRIIVATERDGSLIENDIVYRLGQPLDIEDPGWINAGKVAWDWWNALNVYDVEFESGVNTATYKYYIDFASKYGIDYIILDEGWSNTEDLLEVSPEIDMEELLSYARSKDVGIILWCVWIALDRQMEAAMDQFQEWGIKGIKVDFMQRNDQKMVQFYWRCAREAAEREMLVDYHGSYKPSGLRRPYPNVLTREGVKGLEHSKWSRQPSPEYNVQLPFIRQVAGPMDFTPGATINANRENFRPVFEKPMSMGTRAHQMAMYVVFESPLQMLADNPSHYLEEPEMMDFLSVVPVTWDETIALDSRISDYVAVARRNGEEWYAGAMTDWNARTLTLDCSFLGDGTYTAQIYRDGINADRYASDYEKVTLEVTASDQLNIDLKPGGGWVARFYK